MLTRALETWAVKNADAVTVICEGLRNDLVARGIPPGKITVIPNAVDIDQFAVGGKPDAELKMKLGLGSSRVLGFIARSTPTRPRPADRCTADHPQANSRCEGAAGRRRPQDAA